MAKGKDDLEMAIGITPDSNTGKVTARRAGEMQDLELCISPAMLGNSKAMQNLAKALNLALKTDFLETSLDKVYKGARVYSGAVQIMHRDYIGLGDGIYAKVGKVAKSFQLSFRGPDAASPEGKAWIGEHGGGAISGVLNLIGRKLDVIREFEDKVPLYVEQTLDRLEAKNIINDWDRDEWEITTTLIGLDVVITPQTASE